MARLEFLFINALIWASPVSAQQWVKIVDGSTRVVEYYDSLSLNKFGNKVKVLILSDHKKDQTVKYATVKKRIIVDCGLRTAALSSYSSYDMNEEVISSRIIPQESVEYEQIEPGSAGDAMVNAVCSNVVGATSKAQQDTSKITGVNTTPRKIPTKISNGSLAELSNTPKNNLYTNLKCTSTEKRDDSVDIFTITFEKTGGNANVIYEIALDSSGETIGDVQFAPSTATIAFSAKIKSLNVKYILNVNRKNLEFTGVLIGVSLSGGIPIAGNCEIVKFPIQNNKF